MKKFEIDAVIRKAPYTDPVFAQLEAERIAKNAYRYALDALDKAIDSSSRLLTQPEIQWELYKLQDLESTVSETAKIARQALANALAAKPTSFEGCVALLSLSRDLLSNYPTLTRVTKTIANVEAALIELTA